MSPRNDPPAGSPSRYRVRVVLDFEAKSENPEGLVALAGFVRLLLDAPGAKLAFSDVSKAFPGAQIRAAAVEVVRPNGENERREMEAP